MTSKQLIRFLSEVPSLSPGTGMHLLDIVKRTEEALKSDAAKVLTEKDRAMVEDYCASLKLVCRFAAFHQGVVIAGFEAILKAAGGEEVP